MPGQVDVVALAIETGRGYPVAVSPEPRFALGVLDPSPVKPYIYRRVFDSSHGETEIQTPNPAFTNWLAPGIVWYEPARV